MRSTSRAFLGAADFNVRQRMRILLTTFLSVFLLAAAMGEEERFRPAIVDQKVDSSAFPKEAQIEAPVVVYSPGVVYPIEVRSGIAGEVALYIKINELGYPTRIAVFHSTLQVFERSAVASAIQTKWKRDPNSKQPNDAWFVYNVMVIRRG